MSRFEAVVRKDGKFELNGLPPGRYTTDVESLPPHFEGDPQEIDLAGGACKQLYLRPDTSGEISGRIVTSGKMPQNAFVFLKGIPRLSGKEQENDVRFGADVFADDETGAFSFRHVGPGKYVLVFGDSWEGPTVAYPYESDLYCCSSKHREEAQVFDVSEGQKIRNAHFEIGTEVPRRAIHVKTKWQDGSPAPNIYVQLRSVEKSSNLSDGQSTNASGDANLTAFLGIDYTLEAAGKCVETEPQFVYILNNIPVRKQDTRSLPDQLIPASLTDTSVTLNVPGPKCTLDTKSW